MVRLQSLHMVPASWQRSKSEQASDFLNIALADTSQPTPPAPPAAGALSEDAAPSPSPAPDANVLRSLLHRRSFLLNILGVSVIYPFLFFILLLPLFSTGLHVELMWWYASWVATCIAVLFAESLGRLHHGNRIGLRVLVGIWVASIALAGMAVSEHGNCGPSTSILRTLSVFVALLGPNCFRIVSGLRERLPLRPLAWFAAGMVFGAAPLGLIIVLYVYMLLLEPTSKAGPLVLSLVMWNIAPWLVRPTGAFIVGQSAQAAKVTAPRIWFLYCDLIFGQLGLLVFGNHAAASFAWALTVLPVLGTNVARGHAAVLRCTSWQDARISRLEILLESLSAVLGRMVAYTMFFLMHFAGIVGLGGSLVSEHPSFDSLGHKRYSGISANIYAQSASGHGPIDPLLIWAAAFGVALLIVAFCVFCAILPVLWTAPSREACKVAPAEVLGAARETEEDEFDLQLGGLQKTSPSSAWEIGRDEVAGSGSVAREQHGTGDGWVFGGTARETRRQQNLILNRFLNQHTRISCAMCFFTFVCTISVAQLQARIKGMQASPCG